MVNIGLFIFQNEQITSGIYVICIAMIFGNLYLLPYIVPFLLNHFIIVQLYFIFNIWAITVILHPYPRGLLLEWVYKRRHEVERTTFC